MAVPSIVPSTFRPAFVGGNLGSGLNPSLLRKIQLVQYWLDRQYGDVTLQLVQGSPSGSGESGGTHLGPGDAADLELVDQFGRTPATFVRIACSAMFRLLDCVSYVRGSDVNGDGRIDDSFAFHVHVIDREGARKVYAATLQISQFLAHQNGLLGGHPDLEHTVTNPLTLATYSDAEFLRRYITLGQGAISVPAHTEPEDDDMPLTLFKLKGGGDVVLGDGLRRRHVTWDELDAVVYMGKQGHLRLTQLAKDQDGVVEYTTKAKSVILVREIASLDLAGTEV